MRKLKKKKEKKILINFYTKFGQDTTFHILGKKVEQNHFFPFFKTQNRCLTKNVSFVEKIRIIFFFDLLKHILTPFSYKWEKHEIKLKKMIPINFYTKFGQNTTFHVLEKKSKKVTFFRFSKVKIDV